MAGFIETRDFMQRARVAIDYATRPNLGDGKARTCLLGVSNPDAEVLTRAFSPRVIPFPDTLI